MFLCPLAFCSHKKSTSNTGMYVNVSDVIFCIPEIIILEHVRNRVREK